METTRLPVECHMHAEKTLVTKCTF